MTNRVERELRKLGDHNAPGLWAVPVRAHNTVPVVGKTVGTSTCPKAPSDKALSKAMFKAAETMKKPVAVAKGTPAQVAGSGVFTVDEAEGADSVSSSKTSVSNTTAKQVLGSLGASPPRKVSKPTNLNSEEKTERLEQLRMSLTPQKSASAAEKPNSDLEGKQNP